MSCPLNCSRLWKLAALMLKKPCPLSGAHKEMRS